MRRRRRRRRRRRQQSECWSVLAMLQRCSCWLEDSRNTVQYSLKQCYKWQSDMGGEAGEGGGCAAVDASRLRRR